MPASPCCLAIRRRAPFFAVPVLVLLQQLMARFPPAAAVARTNLTAGAALTPPDYLTSPSGGFAFGFRALDADPTRFILAALAIARGLEYLHDGCSASIIHCDIKPDNILLDGHGLPRITDFGISKLLGTQQVHTTVTNVRGTRGYIAPEWLRSDARVDTKADVYSFGVVLLEMISCRRCQDPVEGADADDETVTLFGWAAQLVGARRIELMLDGDTDVEETERVERFARVALWCIEPNPALRPTMHLVVHMLETTQRAQVEAALPADPPSCYMESSPLIPQLKIE